MLTHAGVGVELDSCTLHSWPLFSFSKENSGTPRPTFNSSRFSTVPDCSSNCIILITVISTYIAEPFPDSHIWN